MVTPPSILPISRRPEIIPHFVEGNGNNFIHIKN
jgi:hypothetical protein